MQWNQYVTLLLVIVSLHMHTHTVQTQEVKQTGLSLKGKGSATGSAETKYTKLPIMSSSTILYNIIFLIKERSHNGTPKKSV